MDFIDWCVCLDLSRTYFIYHLLHLHMQGTVVVKHYQGVIINQIQYSLCNVVRPNRNDFIIIANSNYLVSNSSDVIKDNSIPGQTLTLMVSLVNASCHKDLARNDIDSGSIQLITRIVCIRPKGRTQCIFPLSQHSCLYVYIY